LTEVRGRRPCEQTAGGRLNRLGNDLEDEPPIGDLHLELLAEVEAGGAEPLAGEADERQAFATQVAARDGAEAAAAVAGLAVAVAAAPALRLGVDRLPDVGGAGDGFGEGSAGRVLAEDFEGLRGEAVDEAVFGGRGGWGRAVGAGSKGAGWAAWGRLVDSSVRPCMSLLLVLGRGRGGGCTLCRARLVWWRLGVRRAGGGAPS